MKPFAPRLDFSAAPTVWRFMMDNAGVRIIVGPVGSSKSTGCCAEIMRRALMQEVAPNGVRYFRAAIVRNTSPQLKRTTMETWKGVFPEEACGRIRMSSPIQHVIRIQPKKWRRDLPPDHPDQGTPGLDLIVDFLALDKPKDVRELLSYEGTLIWFNEVREIPKALVDAATLRVGRWPSIGKHGVMPSWFGVICDTNPPDEDHWIYKLDMEERPVGWSFYHQPPGVIEVRPAGDMLWASVEGEPTFATANPRHVHPAAGTLWVVNPAAENLPFLPIDPTVDPIMDPLGPGSYYGKGVGGKDRAWIKAYLQGRYCFVMDGKPVVPEFKPDLMVVDNLEPSKHFPLSLGSDIGGNTLNPAAVIGQRIRGQWRIYAEVIGSDMALDSFTTELKATLTSDARFSNHPIDDLWGDPAGDTRDGIFATTAFQHLRAKGFPARPAPTNDISARIQAIKAPCNRMVDGQPGLLVDRRCKWLVKGLSGAWFFKKVQGSGDSYHDTPMKDHPVSDVCDAAGYLMLGGGEHRTLTHVPPGERANRPAQTHSAVLEFNVFD